VGLVVTGSADRFIPFNGVSFGKSFRESLKKLWRLKGIISKEAQPAVKKTKTDKPPIIQYLLFVFIFVAPFFSI
jgi:hypothetical protein